MRAAFGATVLALAVAASVVGQEAAPREVTIKRGRLATIVVKVADEKTEYVVLGEALDGFREYDGSGGKNLRIRVIGYEVGSGYVVVGTSPMTVIVVKVQESPGPGPGPKPPDPPQPDPVDPLADLIKQAATRDGFKNLKELAAGFRAVVGLVANASTAGDLRDRAALAMKNAMPSGVTVGTTLREFLGQKMDAALPTKPEQTLSQADKDAAVKLFTSLATSCERAAK